MSGPPRVAFVTDVYHEVNGAARTCRELFAYARRKDLPFCCVRYGPKPGLTTEGNTRSLELDRSPLAVPVDPDLKFDCLFYRHRRVVEETLRDFRPDLVHIISMGDAGILGAIAAAVLKVPLVLSWHTNLHEFAARRIGRSLRALPDAVRTSVERSVEKFLLDRVLWFFGRGHVLLAPSPELVDLLRTRTGRPTFYMGRGVDMQQFHPGQRERADETFTIGFVGRLMPEKNVRFLAKLETALEAAGLSDFRIVIVGGGKERRWLEANVRRGVCVGVLHGDELARAYANFDVFVFPSRTDTFGQVVQEAQASGVPTVVTNEGGPQFLVENGVTGFVATSEGQFVDAVVRLKNDPELRQRMGMEAHRRLYLKCWDRIFVEVYKAYELCKVARPALPTGSARGLAPAVQES